MIERDCAISLVKGKIGAGHSTGTPGHEGGTWEAADSLTASINGGKIHLDFKKCLVLIISGIIGNIIQKGV